MLKETQRYAEVMGEQLKIYEETAQLLSTVQTPADMAGVKEKLAGRQEHSEHVARQALAMPEPSAAVRARLQEQFGSRPDRAYQRLAKESQRIKELPGGSAFIKELKLLK